MFAASTCANPTGLAAGVTTTCTNGGALDAQCAFGCEDGYTNDSSSCSPSSWIGYDGVVCGDCSAIVKVRDNGGTCEQYCAEQGLSCVTAWDDTTNNACSLSATRLGCSHSFSLGGTSDGICECSSITSSGFCSSSSSSSSS